MLSILFSVPKIISDLKQRRRILDWQKSVQIFPTYTLYIAYAVSKLVVHESETHLTVFCS